MSVIKPCSMSYLVLAFGKRIAQLVYVSDKTMYYEVRGFGIQKRNCSISFHSDLNAAVKDDT